MDILIQRTSIQSDGVFGTLTGLGLNLATCEHSYLQSDGSYAPKVPAGVYTCRRRMSPHFGFEVFELLNVPNCTFIEIHPGNSEKDSDGCFLLGSERDGDAIDNSRVAFQLFMTAQTDENTFQLTVVDPMIK